MKLFYQLNELEQNNALNHFSGLVITDLIEDGVKLDPMNDDEILLKEKLENAVDYIKQLSSIDEKTNYLLNDADISKAIYDIALDVAKSAYYHESEESIVFIDDISEPNDEDLELPDIAKSKKISDLN